MIKLTDSEKNTSIVYIYVKEFAWTNPTDNENNQGHPKKGRLYRAVHNKDTKSYRLVYKDESSPQGVTAVFLPALTSVEVDTFLENNGYNASMIELTKHNLLECDISEEDLTDAVKWIEEDNKTIKQLMGFKSDNTRPPTQQELANVLQQTQEGQERMRFLENLGHLRELNPPIFDALGNLVDYLVDIDGEHADSTIDASWVGLSKTLGAGKNISDALERLSRYGSESRRDNLMESDLMEAIRALLQEQVRRNFHGIE